jgi:hypothetical protein
MSGGIMHGKKIAVFYSEKNSHGKKDAIGAFIPQATKFSNIHKVPVDCRIGVDCSRGHNYANRRGQVLEGLKRAANSSPGFVDHIVFFCHGWPKGVQFGILRHEIRSFLLSIQPFVTSSVSFTLYSCLNAENDVREFIPRSIGHGTDGGFADVLRDQMFFLGGTGYVDAHKLKGHTTKNPTLVRFRTDRVENPYGGGIGGFWLVEPKSELWDKWVQELKREKADLRYRFPFMTQADIFRELSEV